MGHAKLARWTKEKKMYFVQAVAKLGSANSLSTTLTLLPVLRYTSARAKTIVTMPN